MRNNTLVLILFCLFATGCYTTAPTHWSHSHYRDVIQSHETIPNGSRLDVSGKIDGVTLEVVTKEVPQCRTAELGYQIMKRGGQRNSHGWPGTLFGIGMIGGGATLMGYGFTSSSEDTDEQRTMKLISGLGGIGLGALGAVVFGKCALSSNGCGPDPDMEYYYENGSSFKRWGDEDKKNCSSDSAKSGGKVALIVTTKWANSKEEVTWKDATDHNGNASMRIIDTIRRIGAHCGKATVRIFPDTLDQPDFKDSPTSPSQRRDESTGYKFAVSPSRAESPELIHDAIGKRIAESCAYANTRSCVGDGRATSIENKCKSECNTSNGAGYCEEQRQTELLMPDISEIERKEIDGRYDACVKEHRIDNSSTTACSSTCIDKAFSLLCPKQW